MEAKSKYVIKGRTFTQEVLVLAQMKQIGKEIPKMGLENLSSEFSVEDIVNLLMSSAILERFLAIILKEEGQSLKNKNIEELGIFLEENLDLDLTVEIIKDFFSINNIWKKFTDIVESGTLASLITKYTEMMNKLVVKTAESHLNSTN